MKSTGENLGKMEDQPWTVEIGLLELDHVMRDDLLMINAATVEIYNGLRVCQRLKMVQRTTK